MSSAGDTYRSQSSSRSQSRLTSVLRHEIVEINGASYEKHPQHWYHDGSIGFLVEDMAFLLHGSILAGKSTVMADLLSLPQPTSLPEGSSGHAPSEITLNGVPFVTLHDKAVDFSNILDFIYPTTLPLTRTDHLDGDDLMGIVRFCDKYMIDDLKEWAIEELGDNHLIIIQDAAVRSYLEGKYSKPSFCVRIIDFARECSLPQFLPFAFYALATVDWERRPPEEVLSMDQLLPQDRHRIQSGRIALTRAVVEKAVKWPECGVIAPEFCPVPQCRKGNGMPNSARATVVWNDLLQHPIEELETRSIYSTHLLCDQCNHELQSEAQRSRDDLVSRLGEFFQLEC